MAFNGKILLLVRCSSPVRLTAYQHLVNDLGLTLVCAHPRTVDVFSAVISDWIITETHDVDQLQRNVDAGLAELGIKPDAIVSFDEYGIYPAARLSEHYGLRPFPLPSEAVKSIMIKTTFRDFCAKNGIPSVQHATLTSDLIQQGKPAIVDAVAGMSMPVVVKPSPGAGSVLAKLCESPQAVADHAVFAMQTLSHHRDHPFWGQMGVDIHLIVEEYFGGFEVDVDCIVADGKALFVGISDNKPVKPPYFQEEGGIAPTALSKAGLTAVTEAFDKFLAATSNQLSGVLHFEAKYDPEVNRAVVIEVNPRMGSAETYRLVLGTWGVDLAESFVHVCLGTKDYKPEVRMDGFCASVDFNPPRSGLLVDQVAPKEMTDDSSYVAHGFYDLNGTYVKAPPAGFLACGWMVARGAAYQEANDNVCRLAAMIRFDIDETAAPPK